MTKYGNLAPTDVHDQATYTTAWAPYVTITDDRLPLLFMRKLRDEITAYFHASGQWQHGYWKMHEVHHGTEHFELFLNTVHTLDPDDGDTIVYFLDAAEHLGNWEGSVPEWFDWETGLYHSMWFGTSGVEGQPGSDLNMPDHFRCANLALQAYTMANEERYLALAQRMMKVWANAIVQGSTLPIGLLPTGAVREINRETSDTYHSFAGQAGNVAIALDRAENFLASNGIDTFLNLWQHTQEMCFLSAAQKLLDIIATQVDDPDAGAAVDALMRYRQATSDTRYDKQILAAFDALDPTPVTTLSIEPMPHRDHRPSGIGKRQDMPNWYEDGQPRQRNPILLRAVAHIKQDYDLATQSIDLARGYFALARAVYPDGRDHGCSARSVSAISRGHGRDNNAGVITSVFQGYS